MTTSLILRTQDKFALLPEAANMRELALEKSALIGRVSNADEQKEAVQAQIELKRVIDTFEKARVEAKKPIITAGKQLDKFIEQESGELDVEGNRIAALVVEFEEKERIRIDAENRLAQQKLNEIERKRDEALTKVVTVEEADKVREAYADAYEATRATPAPAVRAEGQRVTDDWDIQVTNPYELARCFPACVKIEPRLSEIKALLNRGITPTGVTATKVIKSSVRVPRSPAIEV